MTSMKPLSGTHAATRVGEVVVTITDTSTDTGRIMVRDDFGIEFEIDGSVRRKGSGAPSPGEKWLIVKKGRSWIPDVMVDAPATPTVSGSRTGMHPIAVQMLEALALQGLVFDETVPVEVDDTDEGTPPDDPEYPGGGDDPPEDPGPEPPDPPDPPDPHDLDYEPLYIGTFNTAFFLSNSKARQDMLHMSKTKVQVFGLQEWSPPARSSILDEMENRGWAYHQASVMKPLTILWRADEFVLLGSGGYRTDEAVTTPQGISGPHGLTWVKLRQKKTGLVFFYADVHIEAHIEANGHPRTIAAAAQDLARAYTQISEHADWLASHTGKFQVFLAGDINVDWKADARVHFPKFPYAAWRRVGMRSNWDWLDAPRFGTHGDRLIDQVFSNRGPVPGQVKAESYRIGTGYHSDHRPLIVKYRVKRKG